jgi:hypothetical protein
MDFAERLPWKREPEKADLFCFTLTFETRISNGRKLFIDTLKKQPFQYCAEKEEFN